METETGRLLAERYLLVEALASGGMAEVWRGRDEVLGRDVAIKILHPHLAADASFFERFRREAVTAARLSHQSIVRIFDTGVDEGLCFIVMELSRGRSLAEILEDRGHLPPQEAVSVARGILDALAHAHRAGVVHRDVKPANVLPERRQVKVTDFGIAKVALGGDLTTTGQLLGTARYLAPEQVEGGSDVDHRADLYSVGLVLFEMLTGRPAFEGASLLAEAGLRLTERPPLPSSIRPGVPAQLDDVVQRAMARDTDDRYSDAGDMRAALDRVAMTLPDPPSEADRARLEDEEPVRAETAPSGGSLFRSWLLVPMVVLLLAGAAIGVGLLVGSLELGGPLGIRPRQGEPATTETRTVEMREAIAHDPPPGDGGEYDELAGLVLDGDEATAWRTEGYSSADLGGLKSGVGLILDLGGTTQLREVTIATPSPGWRFELRASGEPDGFGDPLASVDGETSHATDSSTTVELDGPRARYLLIWITELVDVDGRYRAEISEVEVLGG